MATNGAGTTYGPDMTFHTLPPDLPEISGESASNVTPSSATLSAEINPGLGDTIYLFEYGTGQSYGQATVPSASIGSDEVPHAVSNEISDLDPSTTYHFRVVATNFGGTSYGSDQTFSTPGPPVIDATSHSGVTQTGRDAGSDDPAGAQPDDLPLRVRDQRLLRRDHARERRRSAPTTSSTP